MRELKEATVHNCKVLLEELLNHNGGEALLQTLKKIRVFTAEEKIFELMKGPMFDSGAYKEIISLLTKPECQSKEVLEDVLSILINISCLIKKEEIILLINEKIIEKLIFLLKNYDDISIKNDVIF